MIRPISDIIVIHTSTPAPLAARCFAPAGTATWQTAVAVVAAVVVAAAAVRQEQTQSLLQSVTCHAYRLRYVHAIHYTEHAT